MLAFAGNTYLDFFFLFSSQCLNTKKTKFIHLTVKDNEF